jgi:acyl-CoA dehydrogenase
MSLFMADLDPSACTLQEIHKLGRHAVDSNSLFIDNLRVHRDDLIG